MKYLSLRKVNIHLNPWKKGEDERLAYLIQLILVYSEKLANRNGMISRKRYMKPMG